MMPRKTKGGTSASSAEAMIDTRNTVMVPRYGRAKVHTRRHVPALNSTPFSASLSPGIIE